MNVVPIPTDPSKPGSGKIAGFDAVRAVAALGVVLLHSCVPYMQPAVPGLAWPVHDTPHWIAAECFWLIELFIMPLFLVLAGFLTWQTLQRSGPTRLIQSRAKRLLIPLLFGMVVILPLDLYSWLLGWVTEGIIPLKKLRSLKFDNGIDRDLWGLSHLWFLQYLFLYVLVAAGGAWLWHRASSARQRHVPAAMACVLLLILACVTLYFRPEVVWGFQHRFLPVPSKWIYSGVFFALGAMLAAHDSRLRWLQFHSRSLVAPGVVFAIAALLLGNWHLRGGENQLASVTLAVTTSLSAVMITMSMIGMAAKRIHTVPRSLSYLAAASFWVYIVHHPLLGLIHTDLKWLLPGANPLLKVILAFLLTSALCLAMYEVWVRQTALGRWLGFQWQPPRLDVDREVDSNVDVISMAVQRGRLNTKDSLSERRAA